MVMQGIQRYPIDNPSYGPTTFQKRHLFIDIDNLTRWGVGIHQRFPKAEMTPVTGLECGPHGSWNARVSSGWGSVLYEDGRFRMWGCYMPSIKSHAECADSWLVGYAESEDGLHWTMPDLRQVGQQLWPGNNLINIPGCLLSVVRPLAGADWKYVALAVLTAPPLASVFGHNGISPQASVDYEGPEYDYAGFAGSGNYLYGSNDGIHWQQITRNPIIRHGDVAYLHVDRARGRYLMYTKMGACHGLASRRSLLAVESADLIHWEGYHGYRQWNEVFVGDDYDDVLARQQGFMHGEFNGMTFHQIESLYLSVQAFFLIGQPLVNYAGQNPAGNFVLRLAYSHNGMYWRYPQGRPVFLENAPPGEFGAGYFSATSNILDIGDESLFYLTAFKKGHLFGIKPDFHLDESIAPEEHEGLTASYVVRIMRDRYASLASTYRDVFDAEIGPRQGMELTVNAITRGRGSVRVALAEQNYPLHLEQRKTDSLPGYSFDDCIPIQGDDIRARVRFKEKSLAEIPAGMPLILRVELDGAEIYGYEWRD